MITRLQATMMFGLYSGLILSIVCASALEAQEQCIQDAWEAYNDEAYEDVLRHADRCIDDFGRAAQRQQAAIDSSGAPCPPTGRVSDAERNRIFQRGLLNDVATAYFLKGRAAEFLYRAGGPEAAAFRSEAEGAYHVTCEYGCGRTWDPRGFFWSPCEAASDRLPLR